MHKTMMMVLALAAGLPALAGTAQARTIWDGVYSDAQADRGHTLYMQNCSRCHGANLWGTYEIPPLVGRIMPYYAGSGLDVFFDYISTAMPLSRPGSLPPAANADIVAYILKVNEVPSGSRELTPDAMKAITFTVHPMAKRAKK